MGGPSKSEEDTSKCPCGVLQKSTAQTRLRCAFKFPWQASLPNDGKSDGVSSVNILLMSSLSF